jgi:hypothetical protein
MCNLPYFCTLWLVVDAQSLISREYIPLLLFWRSWYVQKKSSRLYFDVLQFVVLKLDLCELSSLITMNRLIYIARVRPEIWMAKIAQKPLWEELWGLKGELKINCSQGILAYLFWTYHSKLLGKVIQHLVLEILILLSDTGSWTMENREVARWILTIFAMHIFSAAAGKCVSLFGFTKISNHIGCLISISSIKYNLIIKLIVYMKINIRDESIKSN